MAAKFEKFVALEWRKFYLSEKNNEFHVSFLSKYTFALFKQILRLKKLLFFDSGLKENICIKYIIVE